MQLFINNWSAALTAPATGSAVQLSIDPAQAAKLVGLGSGDYYLLTLALVDAGGSEIAWEPVKVTAVSGGTLTVVRGQEGAAALEWASGSSISGRVTADTLSRLRDGGNPAAMIIAYGAVIPFASEVGQLLKTDYDNSMFVAYKAGALYGWKRICGAPLVTTTGMSPSAGPAIAMTYDITRNAVSVWAPGGIAAPTTLHASVNLPALPVGSSLLDDFVISVGNIGSQPITLKLRIYDAGYDSTDISLAINDGLQASAVRGVGYVELTICSDIKAHCSIACEDDNGDAFGAVEIKVYPAVSTGIYGLGK